VSLLPMFATYCTLHYVLKMYIEIEITHNDELNWRKFGLYLEYICSSTSCICYIWEKLE